MVGEKSVRVSIPDFSIEQIALSGQCFRICKVGDDALEGERTPLGEGDSCWLVRALGRELLIIQHSDSSHTFFCSEKEFRAIWFSYFDLDRDYSDIKRRILALDDLYLAKAVAHGWGLRILRQDPWEVLVSFIISQRNNIPRIRRLIERLCLGAHDCANAPISIVCENRNAPFPSSHVLAQLPDDFFTGIGLGYRGAYVKSAAVAVSTGTLNLQSIQHMPNDEAITHLKTIAGVGDKVAHCVALFGLHQLCAFPRDVWINRIIEMHYRGDFCLDGVRDIAGVIQQYMFFFERRARY